MHALSTILCTQQAPLTCLKGEITLFKSLMNDDLLPALAIDSSLREGRLQEEVFENQPVGSNRVEALRGGTGSRHSRSEHKATFERHRGPWEESTTTLHAQEDESPTKHFVHKRPANGALADLGLGGILANRPRTKVMKKERLGPASSSGRGWEENGCELPNLVIGVKTAQQDMAKVVPIKVCAYCRASTSSYAGEL